MVAAQPRRRIGMLPGVAVAARHGAGVVAGIPVRIEQHARLRGVPGRLVRRNPATQALITRAKAAEGRWRTLDLTAYWPTALAYFLDHTPLDSIVLAVPTRMTRKGDLSVETLMQGLRVLREEGIAEPE